MYRFAFSPTDDMTINDLRVALLNYICAKQAGEQLIVRIEDGDKARLIEGKDQEMLEMLELFGISFSQLYYQSNNFKYHLQFASTLLDTKKAFI
jgi:glutamyl-tRNA synthetase